MEGYELRRLVKTDYSSQYFALLRQLTSCNEEKITKSIFDHFLDSLSENHQIWLIIEIKTKRIVGTGTLLIEQKIINDMGSGIIELKTN